MVGHIRLGEKTLLLNVSNRHVVSIEISDKVRSPRRWSLEGNEPVGDAVLLRRPESDICCRLFAATKACFSIALERLLK